MERRHGCVGRVGKRAERSGPPEPASGRGPRACNAGPDRGPAASAGGRIETTQEELAAFEVIHRLLGRSRRVAYEGCLPKKTMK